jgi:hypothetical protein
MLRDHKVGKVLIAHLTASAESGSTYAQKAQYVLGMVMYQSACGQDDFLDAARWIRKAAKQGVSEAQYELGKMFHHIYYYVQMRLARKYIRRASKQGHVEATACMKELRKCVFCGADDAPLACSRCREARYCDSTCSEKHWCDGGGVGRDVDGRFTEPHSNVCPRSYSRSQRKKKKKQQLERGK